MTREERLFKIFEDTWKNIREGNFFDEQTNQVFEYSIKALITTSFKDKVKSLLAKDLPAMLKAAENLENPPPYLYIIISLKNSELLKIIEIDTLRKFIKTKGSENSTFQLLNLINTMHEKGIPVQNIVNSTIKIIKPDMNRDMVSAFSTMISIQHPEFIGNFLKKFMSFAGSDEFLMDYIKSTGRKTLLEFISIAPPNAVKTVINKLKSN